MFDFTFDAFQRLLLALPIFLIAVTFHEFMHGWAADKLGDPTARMAGRLTFNPLAHLDLFGSIFFVLAALTGFFFGWAKPVPVNPYNFRNWRRDNALVAVSGPGANFMLAWAFYMAFFALRTIIGPLEYASAPMIFVLGFLRLGVIINIVLICFNLIPIPPLDGSRVLAWILPARYSLHLDRLEPYGFIILIVLLWTGIIWYIYEPILMLVSRLFPGIYY